MTLLKQLMEYQVTLASLVFLAFFASCNRSMVDPTQTLAPTLHPTASITITPTSTIHPTATFTTTPAPTITPTLTPSKTFSPTQTMDPSWIVFDSEWLQLYYPKEWNFEEPLGTPGCVPEDIYCIIRITHSPSETVEITMSRFPPMGTSLDVIQADKDDWNTRKIGAAIVGAADFLELISVDEIEVDGVKAVKRLYKYPLVDMKTGKVKNTQFNLRVLIILGEFTFSFEMKTTGAEEFDKYIEVANQMISSLSFHR